MNRKYKKSSWVGKVYKWTKGHYQNTDSCSVKKVVLWEAPIKLFFKQKLFYFSPLDASVHTWFIWHTAIQIYMVAHWGRLSGAEENFIWLDVLILPTLPFVGIITLFEALAFILLVGVGVVSALKWAMNRIRGKVVTPIENRMRTVSDPVEDYFTEWWDELKNKLCKPVTWVD